MVTEPERLLPLLTTEQQRPLEFITAYLMPFLEREEREGESLEYKLSAEEPDVPPDAAPPTERPTRVHRGQIDGTPEDGDSLFNVDR